MSQLTIHKRTLDDTPQIAQHSTDLQAAKRAHALENRDHLFVITLQQEPIRSRIAYYLPYADLEAIQSTCLILNELNIDFTKFKNICERNTQNTICNHFYRFSPYTKYISLRINYGFKNLRHLDNIEPIKEFLSLTEFSIIPKLYSVASLKLRDNSNQAHYFLFKMGQMARETFLKNFKNLRHLKLPALEVFMVFIRIFANNNLIKFNGPANVAPSQVLQELGLDSYLSTITNFAEIPLKHKELKLAGDYIFEALLKVPTSTILMEQLSALTIKKPMIIKSKLAAFVQLTKSIPRIGFSHIDEAFLKALKDLPDTAKSILFPKIDKLTFRSKIVKDEISEELKAVYVDIFKKSAHSFRYKNTSCIPDFIFEPAMDDQAYKKIYQKLRYLNDEYEHIHAIQYGLDYADRIVKIQLQSLDQEGPTNLIQRSFEKYNFNQIQRILQPVRKLVMGSYEYRMHPVLLTHILLSAKKLRYLDLGRPTTHFEQYIELLENNQSNGKAKGELLKDCFTFPELRLLKLDINPQSLETILRYCPELEKKISNDFEPGISDTENQPIIIDPQFTYGPQADLVEPASESDLDIDDNADIDLSDEFESDDDSE